MMWFIVIVIFINITFRLANMLLGNLHTGKPTIKILFTVQSAILPIHLDVEQRPLNERFPL